MDVKYDLIITPGKKQWIWTIHIIDKRFGLLFFVRFYDNISCVSLGRAHWPRAGVAARGPEGLVRKSSPPDTGSHSNHSNQHNREQQGPGWWPQEGRWVEGEGKKKSLHHRPRLCSFINRSGSTCRPPPSLPALCCVGGRLTFPALPGGSSPESWVILRGRQRTNSNTAMGFQINTHLL